MLTIIIIIKLEKKGNSFFPRLSSERAALK